MLVLPIVRGLKRLPLRGASRRPRPPCPGDQQRIFWLSKMKGAWVLLEPVVSSYLSMSNPDFPIALGMISKDSTIVRGWGRVMEMVYRDADRIVVLGESMKRRLMPKPQRRRWRSGRITRPIPKNGASVPELPSRPTLPVPTQSRRTGASLRRCIPRPDEEGPPQREYGAANRERLGGFVDLIPSAEDHYARSSARDRRKRLLMGVGSFRPPSRNLRRSNTAFKTSSEHSVPWIVISGS